MSKHRDHEKLDFSLRHQLQEAQPEPARLHPETQLEAAHAAYGGTLIARALRTARAIANAPPEERAPGQGGGRTV